MALRNLLLIAGGLWLAAPLSAEPRPAAPPQAPPRPGAPVAPAPAVRPVAPGARPGAPVAARPDEYDTPAKAAARLTFTYEQRAKEALETYVPPREFHVNATVTPSGKVMPRAPYEPKSMSTGTTLNMTAEELQPYVAKVEIEILLSTRLSGAKKRIEELLFKSLKLDKARDRISFGNLGIELESEDWRKEKFDLKREMEVLKSENTRLAQEISQKDSAIRNAEKPAAPIAMNTKTGWSQQDWFWPALVGGAAFILLLGMFLVGRGLLSAGRSMGGAISTVASAMERLGGASATASEGPSGNMSLEAKMITEGGTGKQQAAMSALPMETIHSHILKTRNEILENLNEGAEAVILQHLTQLLSNEKTIGRAVATLELLGRDTATEFFKRLGVRSQEGIMSFLRLGGFGGSKIEMMLEAAEELKTKLRVESFDRVRGKPSESVAQRLIQLSDDEMVQLALDIEPEHLPRLFLYFDAPKIAQIVGVIRRVNPDKFALVLPMLGKLPEAAGSDAFDDNILVALEAIIEKTKADFQRPFLKVYQDIVESSDEEVGEQIVRELSQDPRLDEFFRQNVISLNTFFLLPKDTQKELIEAMSNKDVAALASGSKEQERDEILGLVSARRKSMVAEEFDSLTARGGRQAQYAFKRVRDALIKRLKDMKSEGLLTNLQSTANRNEGGSNEGGNGNGGGEDRDAA